jgi:hypothetical protein
VATAGDGLVKTNKTEMWDVATHNVELPGHACATTDGLWATDAGFYTNREKGDGNVAAQQTEYPSAGQSDTKSCQADEQREGGGNVNTQQTKCPSTCQSDAKRCQTDEQVQVNHLEDLATCQSKQQTARSCCAKWWTKDRSTEPAPGVEPPMPHIAHYFTTIVQVNGCDAVALIDSGATGNMLSPLCAKLANVKTVREQTPVTVTIADNSQHNCAGIAMSVALRMGDKGHTMKMAEDFFVPSMPLPEGFDLILGLPWLQKWRPLFNWEPPISALIATSRGTIKLSNNAPKEKVEESEEEIDRRQKRKRLIASVL